MVDSDGVASWANGVPSADSVMRVSTAPPGPRPDFLDDRLTGTALSLMLPKKPRTPRSLSSRGQDGRWPYPPSGRSHRNATSGSIPEVFSRSGAATPAMEPPVFGPEPLPSERIAARQLHLSLMQAFERSPRGATAVGASPTAAELCDEWELLNLCTRQLVKQLGVHCADWGEVLEAVRGRHESLWADASRMMRRPGGWDALAAEQQIEALAAQLDAAEARASEAERRAALLSELPAQVESLSTELAISRALISEQRERDRSESRAAVSYSEALALSEAVGAMVASGQIQLPAARVEHDGCSDDIEPTVTAPAQQSPPPEHRSPSPPVSPSPQLSQSPPTHSPSPPPQPPSPDPQQPQYPYQQPPSPQLPPSPPPSAPSPAPPPLQSLSRSESQLQTKQQPSPEQQPQQPPAAEVAEVAARAEVMEVGSPPGTADSASAIEAQHEMVELRDQAPLAAEAPATEAPAAAAPATEPPATEPPAADGHSLEGSEGVAEVPTATVSAESGEVEAAEAAEVEAVEAVAAEAAEVAAAAEVMVVKKRWLWW